jgi:co-chaperonin GroES (HSP10)
MQIEALKISSKEFTPLPGQVLIEYDRDTESEGGIKYARPETTWYGTVLRTGSDGVKEGERVFVSQFRGENIMFSDGEFTMIQYTDILAVIE